MADNKRIKEQLKDLPDCPGVYLHKDKLGQILYVGKAASLRSRIRQYFRSPANQDPKTRALVAQIEDFEYITCGSEMEALILDCNLIKRHRPKYNVLLRDDKTYPYIKVTLQEDFPRVLKTRRIEADGAKYFGPYSDAGAVNTMVDLLSDSYSLKHCSSLNFPANFKPCLNYHIGLCKGPCVGGISRETYGERIKGVLAFLSGKDKPLMDALEAEMKAASGQLNFERAATLRDSASAMKAIREKQRVVLQSTGDFDIVLAAPGGSQSVILFFVIDGKLSGRESHALQAETTDRPAELVAAFMKQYYGEVRRIPSEILVAEEPDEKSLIEAYLSDLKGSKVVLRIPQRGEKKALLDLALKDVTEMARRLEASAKQKQEKAEALSREWAMLIEAWRRGQCPEKNQAVGSYRLEAYDISNTNGVDTVGAMVVFEGSKPLKKAYRRFKIKTTQGQDDYAALQEMIYRRLKRALAGDPGFETLPQALLIDGGKGQVSAVYSVVKALGLGDNLPIFGMAKDDNHRTRALVWLETSSESGILPGFIELNLAERPLLLRHIGAIQEEVHRFAIDYHRGLQNKRMSGSVLDEIPGIGPKKRNALLKAFGSIDAIKEANVEALCQVPGITPALAEEILKFNL